MSEVKRCTKCREVKPLGEFPPDKGRRDGRQSWCRVCYNKHTREHRWRQQGLPESVWQRLHQEADRKAEARAARRNSVPDGFKACTRCHEVKPLAEFSPDKGRRDGRKSRCRVCDAKRCREASWEKQGIPESAWSRLHREADRKAKARTGRPVERHRIMRELSKQHGLKYCPGCDMCLGRAFFHHSSSRADGLRQHCKACESARKAAYFRTDAGRASSKGRNHRRRARLRELPTDGSGPRDWLRHHEETDTWQCHLCGGGFERGDDITWDHRDPITGGTTGTVVANMAAAHAACNYARNNTPLEEWHARVGVPDGVV